MRVTISPQELRLLESHDETKDLTRTVVVRAHRLVLEGTGYQLAMLREACGDLLVRIGFDDDFNPNATGRMLEDLIDKLFEDEVGSL
ncbi:hypothetical protein SAMN02800692_3280 [Luteibacter sp. UNC138MFCol5.1]|nr:hypothetical protein SAMN02800692_3280 [Luteibacter sp. UNC138MFCol5.1]